MKPSLIERRRTINRTILFTEKPNITDINQAYNYVQDSENRLRYEVERSYDNLKTLTTERGKRFLFFLYLYESRV